jgi:hypothetical protein
LSPKATVKPTRSQQRTTEGRLKNRRIEYHVVKAPT